MINEMTNHGDNSYIYNAAHEAGHSAAMKNVPEPMVITDGRNVWHESEGLCGFAWIHVKGNTGFGRWAAKQGLARKAYGGGLHFWVSEYGQSVDRKSAYAQAFANTLQKFGIQAQAGSRLD